MPPKALESIYYNTAQAQLESFSAIHGLIGQLVC
jgi:hypothetical protein